MQKAFGERCAASRSIAGFSQEIAAELLHVSLRSLSDYERGVTLPSSEVIVGMMDFYNDPMLGYEFLRLNSVGYRLLPEIKSRQLSASILSLQVEMSHATAVQSDMAEVGCDDQVGDEERNRWQKSLEEIRHLTAATFSVLLSPIQKEKSPVLAHRR